MKEMKTSRFQEQLYHVIRKLSPDVVVETGHATGLSAVHIVAAMDINDCGTLYSVECNDKPAPLRHKRLKFVRGYSHDKLGEIFLKSGPWDIFIHDSDHDAGCQTYEYEMALNLTKNEGIIMSDDYEWGTHGSWKAFVERNGLTPLESVGSLAVAQKTSLHNRDFSTITPEFIENCHARAKELANIACQKQFGKNYIH